MTDPLFDQILRLFVVLAILATPVVIGFELASKLLSSLSPILVLP